MTRKTLSQCVATGVAVAIASLMFIFKLYAISLKTGQFHFFATAAIWISATYIVYKRIMLSVGSFGK